VVPRKLRRPTFTLASFISGEEGARFFIAVVVCSLRSSSYHFTRRGAPHLLPIPLRHEDHLTAIYYRSKEEEEEEQQQQQQQ